MSPVFHNTLSHIVTATGEKGQTVRIEPGRVKDVPDSVAAAQFAGYSDRGVREVSGEEAAELLAKQAADTVSPELSAESKLAEQTAAARRELTRVQVSAPLQVVVGDDAAPYGPPSGTVSTKQAEAAKSPEARRQFADNEPLIGERIDGVPDAPGADTSARRPPSPAAIHNRQETNRAGLEDAIGALGLAGEHAGGGGSAFAAFANDGEEPELEGEGESDELPRGQELDAALEAAGLSKSGTVAEKQARLAEYRAAHPEA